MSRKNNKTNRRVQKMYAKGKEVRFNKRQEDFPSLREYNDYLEEVEDMRKDAALIEVKINKYKKENAEQIANAEARKAEELAAALKASKEHPVHTDTTDLGVQASQGAICVQGQYAPTTILGSGLGQPRPTRPLPLGGHIDPLHGYAADNEEGMKLRAERAARASGWTVELSKKRALEEAFSTVWI